MKHYDFIVVGAGIFGVTAALALRQRKYMVGLLNPGDIPHPLAASTDISKAVRMEYGADLEYMDMVEEAIDGWQAWNEQFGDALYHEAGFLMLCKHEADRQTFEWSSYRNLIRKGYRPEHLDDAAIRQRFPAFASGAYREAFFNPRAGFAESGRVVRTLLAYAAELGVDVHPRHTASRFECTGGRLTAVHTLEGGRFDTGQAVVCAGAYTPYLLPELKPFMKSTGHPVFHIKPRRPDLFTIPNLPVFAADISNTGWYGFPLHPREGVVKIANHGIGLEIDPDHDERVVTAADMRAFREFLRENMPALAEDPVVFTRRCLYSDTLDGHFWIDRHPEITGLTVAAGGSGHALKMAPALGDMIATVAEGGDHRWAARHRWRVLKPETRQVEEARYKKY